MTDRTPHLSDAAGPTHLGPYTVLGLLRSGSFGTIYTARSRGGQSLAITAVRPELVEDISARERLRTDVTAARVVAGASILPVIGADFGRARTVDRDRPRRRAIAARGSGPARTVAGGDTAPSGRGHRLGTGQDPCPSGSCTTHSGRTTSS